MRLLDNKHLIELWKWTLRACLGANVAYIRIVLISKAGNKGEARAMATEGLIEANAKEVADAIIDAANKSTTEEDLRIRVELILRRKVLDALGVGWASYESRVGKGTLVEGRVDALYGRVVIEYEKPKAFDTDAGFRKAVEQGKGYIQDLAGSPELFVRYFGVVLDGYKVGFVRFRRAWEIQGPFPVNHQTVLKLLEAIRGLRRKALNADLLNKDLGPESSVAKSMVRTLYSRLGGSRNPRVEMLFEDWRRVFKQVCGYSTDKIRGLETFYGIKQDKVDYEALLFSVHTYFALVMKLLAAEVAVSLGDSYLQSYIRKIEEAYLKGPVLLKDMLRNVEEGDIFNKIGIKNFLEADYFGWYLDEWDKPLAEAVGALVRVLSNYEPATAELEPDEVKDLLKRLYQYLVPKKIRHDLGEYYTPDWLADLVLNEVGYDGDSAKRLLDPACGSGTFLVLAIRRAKRYAQENFISESDALEQILRGIVGFDLNPLAVIAARTNYLIALGSYIRNRKEDIQIPVYLADSILVETRSTLTGTNYVLRTSVGEFVLPSAIVDKGLLTSTLGILEECVTGNYSKDEFKARLLKDLGALDEKSVSSLVGLYRVFLDLESKKKNRIWARVLKNSFAPLFCGRFDYVVGNPPWINWENLPEDYREKTRDVWQRYGLMAGGTGKASLGKAKRDMAMLFTYACIDRYLLESGHLGFLITQTVFKSVAGEGFRSFKAPSGLSFRTTNVHDLVELLPFEGAQNRTAAIFCIKGGMTDYPVPYILWKGSRVDQELDLETVRKITTRINLEARPLTGRNGPWSTLRPKAHKAVEAATGPSTYRAFEGVNTALNAAYWVRILDTLPGGNLLVENITEGSKKGITRIQATVEKDTVYQLLRGRDVGKWKAKSESHIILPVDQHGAVLKASELRASRPKTYGWFDQFFGQLIARGGEPYKSQLKPWREKSRRIAEAAAPPFYMLFNVSRSLSPFKVTWKEQAGGLTVAVINPAEDTALKNSAVVLDHKLMFVPCSDEDEAHFICAVLNSSISRLIAISYIVGIQISTHILEHVRVPKYNQDEETHRRLVALSKKAHTFAALGENEKVSKIEEEVDQVVGQIYGLEADQAKEIKDSLKILEGEPEKGEEVEE
jgi:hypothetical protein